MTILAIDPGPAHSAWVLWDGEKILDGDKVPNFQLAGLVHASVGADLLAIEMIASYGMPVGAEVFDTCVWIGRFSERWEMTNRPETLTTIKRKEVCVHLCGSARAKDANIRQALIDRIGKPGTKKAPGGTFGVSGDVWAALAVAVTVHDRIRCGIV